MSDNRLIEIQATTGDVTGPIAAGADRIAVFNGTTGKIIKDGGYTIAEILASSGSIWDSVTGGINYAGGKVGIGTTSPDDLLEVNQGHLRISNTGAPRLIFNENNADYWRILVDGGKLRFDSADNSSFSSYNTTLHLLPSGNVGIGRSNPNRKLHVYSTSDVLATFESSDANAMIAFQDSNTADNLNVRIGALTNDFRIYAGGAERLRVNSSGNVGINNTAPSYPLTVNSIAAANTNGYAAEFKRTNVGTGIMYIGFDAGAGRSYLNIYPSGDVKWTLYDGTTYRSPFYLDASNGYVGINDETPTYQLDVTGTGRFTGQLKSQINTAFSGTYPVLFNVGGIPYSNANITFNGTSNILSTKGIYATGAVNVYGGNRLTVYDSVPNNRLIIEADTTSAYLYGTYSSGGTQSIRINPNAGNVGIRTGSVLPAYPLDVTGSARFTSKVYIGILSTNNEASIHINPNNAGSPQIGFSDYGDMAWAIGGDDADNSFKIHGTTSGTVIPTINGLVSPHFEITTSGQTIINGTLKANQTSGPNTLGIELTSSGSNSTRIGIGLRNVYYTNFAAGGCFDIWDVGNDVPLLSITPQADGYKVYIPPLRGNLIGAGANTFINGATGQLQLIGSSRALKSDIVYNVDPTLALQLKPVEFTFISSEQNHIGFIAEDVDEIDARFAQNKDAEFMSLDTTAILSAAIATIKDLATRIEILENA